MVLIKSSKYDNIYSDSDSPFPNWSCAIFSLHLYNIALLMKFTLFCFLIVFSSSLSAQFAVVDDSDGFVYVRSGAGKNFPVIDSLKNRDVVYQYEGESSWVNIDYQLSADRAKSFKSGYVHSSRIKLVQTFTEIPRNQINDTLIKFKWDSCQLIINEQYFNPKKHRFTYHKYEDQDSVISKIDGRDIWGTDGDLPQTQYGKCQLKLGKKVIDLPSASLFNPNLHLTSLFIDRFTNTLYLSAFNSDGAGGYVVLWEIRNGTFYQQFIAYGF